ncbi:MAG: TIR domain-containing protein, partial [Cyanobacteria bacterium J06656_5]
MNPLQDAFISYGRADSKQFAQKLSERLTGLGNTVWFDVNDIPLGVDYQKQIDDGIEKADNFLYLISPHSVNSEYCSLEVELALKRNKRIIPLLHVEEISYETWQQRNPDGTEAQWEEFKAAGKHSHFTNMHPEIRKINWVYFREGIDDFEQSFQGLLELLGREKDHVHQHTVLLNNALEWERNQKQTRYLLTGEDRQQAEAWLAKRFKDSQPPVVPTDLHYEYITESIKNGDNLMTQVFLSHGSEDAEITDQVRRTLMRSGITTWTYRSDIEYGSDFESALKRGVEEADNVLFLMSRNSLASKYCQQELDLAVQLNKRLIIMLAGSVDETDIPVAFRNLQYIDLTDNETEEDYLKDEDDLLRVLKQDASYFNEHKVLLTKALKWERQQRNPCILLQGYELQHAQAWQEVAQAREHHGPTDIQTEFIEASKNQTAAVSPDVFISYSRADSDFARKLNNALQRQRKRTWFDQESIASGADFKQEIYKGIESSNFFLFVLSPRSVKSPYCADEVEYATKLNKRMVTILHRPVEAKDLHPELAKVQWTDFNANEGEFEANFKELLRTLDTDPVHLRYHTGLLMKAIEWDEKGRREDVLLRGSELTEAQQWIVKAAEKEPRPTVLQGEYVTASRELLESTQVAKAKQQRNAVRRLRVFLAASLLLTCFSVFKTYQAGRQRMRAYEAIAEATAETDPLSSLVHGLAAINLGQSWFVSFPQWNKKPLLTSRVLATANENRLFEIVVGHGLPTAISDTAGSPDWQKQIVFPIFKFVLDGTKIIFADFIPSGEVWSVVFSPDGQMIASGGSDGTIRLWDTQGNSIREPLKGHNDWVNSIAFSPDGQMIASGGSDGTIRLWDTQGNTIAPPLKGHSAAVRAVVFDPNGQMILSGSEDGTLRLWDTQSSSIGKPFKGHKSWVNSVAFSSDGQTIVSGSEDGTVRIWDIQGNSVGKPFKGHKDSVMSLAFSPDSQIIASASKDANVRLWNIQGNPIGKPLAGHSSVIWSLAFSPDGQTIASGSKDGTVRLWDTQGNSIGKPLMGHSS